MHAADLASEFGIGTVLIPRHAGVLSALGMLAADIVRDYSASVRQPADALSMSCAHVKRGAAREPRAPRPRSGRISRRQCDRRASNRRAIHRPIVRVDGAVVRRVSRRVPFRAPAAVRIRRSPRGRSRSSHLRVRGIGVSAKAARCLPHGFAVTADAATGIGSQEPVRRRHGANRVLPMGRAPCRRSCARRGRHRRSRGDDRRAAGVRVFRRWPSGTCC